MVFGLSEHDSAGLNDSALIAAARDEIRRARDQGEGPLRAHAVGSSNIDPLQTKTDSSPPSAGDFALSGYEILRQLREGAQGVVFEAIHVATRRKVAIKVMRGGSLAGAAGVERFDREIRILASMRHPNIVAIHDSGVVTGAHYFVMDFVDGCPLDAFVSQSARDVRAMLRLFATIAEAVNAAQLRGVVHRDLKPGNILVSPAGEPFILDFGLAKAMPEQGDAATGSGAIPALVETMSGQFVGSLPWAAPEQAQGRHDRIDPRTDVYSLGVLMYQLLSGKFPYDVTGPMHEVLPRIMHAEPPRPGIAQKDIDDEVDTIILKCLQKEQDRRYQSAGELARDIGRYLAHEPIEAKRDSVLYFLGKQARRYRAHVAVAGCFLFTIAAGLVFCYAQWSRADRERDAASVSAKVAQTEAAHSDQVVSLLKQMLAGIGPAVALGRDTRLLRDIVDETALRIGPELRGQPAVEARLRLIMGQAYADLDDAAKAEEMLRESARLFVTLHGEDSIEAAQAFDALGVALWSNGQLAEAEALSNRALEISTRRLGRQSGLAAHCQFNLAILKARQPDYSEAEALFREALATQCRLLGEEDLNTAATRASLGELLRDKGDAGAAREQLERALATRRRLRNPNHPDIATTLHSLSSAFRDLAMWVEAEQAEREALTICETVYGRDTGLAAAMINNLAIILQARGQAADAEAHYRESLSIYIKRHGEQHLEAATVMAGLGELLRQRKQYTEAEPLLRRSLEIRRQLHSGAHPSIAAGLLVLGNLMQDIGRLDDSEQLLREALDMQLRVHGARHPHVALCKHDLARLLRRRARADEAEPLARDAVAIWRAARGDSHPDVANALDNLATILWSLSRFDEAESTFREALAIYRKVHPKDHAKTAQALHNIAVQMKMQDKLADAQTMFLEAADMRLRLFGDRSVDHARSLTNLAVVLQDRGNAADAVKYASRAESILRDELPNSQTDLEMSLATIGGGTLELAWRDWEGGDKQSAQDHARAAERSLRDLLDFRLRSLQPDDWRLANTRSLLGGAILALGVISRAEGDGTLSPSRQSDAATLLALQESEAMLLAGHAGLLRAAPSPQPMPAVRITQAVQRLVKLYEEWDRLDPDAGKSKQAAQWRGKLGAPMP